VTCFLQSIATGFSLVVAAVLLYPPVVPLVPVFSKAAGSLNLFSLLYAFKRAAEAPAC